MKAHADLDAPAPSLTALALVFIVVVFLLVHPGQVQQKRGQGFVRDTSSLVRLSGGSLPRGGRGQLLITAVRETIQGPELAKARSSMATAQRDAVLAATECAMAPITVRIDPKGLSGGSAGLMLAVTIVRDLLQRDITRGRIVAGTGTIGTDGSVGPIGRIRDKAMAAERAGADIFLVPSDQRAEALKAVREMDVVGVRSLNEAMRVVTNNGCLSETSRRENA